MGWAIALHGGAGDISRSMPEDTKRNIELALRHCLATGVSALQASRPALDVAELVVKALEDNPIFNAGKGSVLTTSGTVEMEASIMDGPTKNCGAVSGLSRVVNPISLARLVMEKTPHIYLAFDGAEEFAKKQGVELADPEYFITEARAEALRKFQTEQLDPKPRTETRSQDASTSLGRGGVHLTGDEFVGETVGCVVVDKLGHCAAATSTGGRTNKMVGRIGDTPLIGAGNYANNLCAVSATGIGEYIIRGMVGLEVAAIMEYKELPLREAVDEVIERRVEKGTTGLIAVSNSGEMTMAFNTTGMFRAAANEDGHAEVGIWQETSPA